MKLLANYFDGQTTRARVVELRATPGVLWFRGEHGQPDRRVPLAEISISEQLGTAPRMISLRDGAHLEVSDHAGLAAWIAQVGYRERPVDLAGRSWNAALVAIVLVLLAGFAGYRYGLPLAAEFIAARVPQSVTEDLTQGTLALLEQHLLKPSALSAERQQALTQGFNRLQPGVPVVLLFRAAPEVGPNAMALPDGTILLLDELVQLADNDEQVLAVLAHELAHVENRHALRLMIQGAAAGAFAAWWIGDYTPLITAAPVAVLQARHSRELEAEADASAAQRLKRVGIRASRLAEMLQKLASAHAAKAGAEAEKAEGPGKWLGYLASHPATDERIAAIRAADTP